MGVLCLVLFCLFRYLLSSVHQYCCSDKMLLILLLVVFHGGGCALETHVSCHASKVTLKTSEGFDLLQPAHRLESTSAWFRN